MANLLRTAKSGNDWTKSDLQAYRIRVKPQDENTFFGVTTLPYPTVPFEVLTAATADDMLFDEGYRLVRYMDLAMSPVPDQESAVSDFMLRLLEMMGFAPRGRVIRTRSVIPFFICNEWKHAKTDVCVVDDSEGILLIVQEDLEIKDVVPQLIAQAVAAFWRNNEYRRHKGLPIIESKITAGIIMTGSHPTFYKIPVTYRLTRSIQLGTFPEEDTIVTSHLPNLARPFRRFIEGMRPLDNRYTILSCFEAFKTFIC